MKFSIIFGAFPNEGSINCNGILMGDLDLTSVEGVHPNTMAYQYDDENLPNYNGIEYYPHLDPEALGLPTQLTAEQAQYWYDWARTKCESAAAQDEAERQYVQYQADYKLYHQWEGWDISSLPREKRDELLHLSDCYSLLPNLDATGWEAWRVWLRNLPATTATPMDITEWREPPANATEFLKLKFRYFKKQIDWAISKRDSYVDYVPPAED